MFIRVNRWFPLSCSPWLRVSVVKVVAMDVWQPSEWVEVRRASDRGRGGRGVFARRDIAAGTLIERSPVLLIRKAQVFADDPDAPSPGPDVSWYVFDWSGHADGAYVGLAMGYGSIYNHSADPNADWTPAVPDTLLFHATRDIPAGAEVFISYLSKDADGHDLGFEPSR